jgi:hypothetical protein
MLDPFLVSPMVLIVQVVWETCNTYIHNSCKNLLNFFFSKRSMLYLNILLSYLKTIIFLFYKHNNFRKKQLFSLIPFAIHTNTCIKLHF